MSHYRKSLVFSYENLDNAVVSYDKLISRIASLDSDDKNIDNAAFDELKSKFTDALDNDINTSLAITAVYDVLKAKTNDGTKLALIADFDKVLSLDLISHAEKAKTKKNEFEIPAEIAALVEERAQARKNKDFAKADELRDKITQAGYIIEETRQGTIIKPAN